jgi:hypothetical protein
MPNLPVPALNDVAIQNNTTGAVDYLQFRGNTLVHSNFVDYGIGPSWQVVAHGDFNGDGHQDLVIQNTTTHNLDFLFLNANAQLIGSALNATSLPTVVGGGSFGTSNHTLVGQLANGQLDMMNFNSAGTLVASDLIANTVGSAKAVGVGESNASFPAFSGIGSGVNDDVFLQLADGSVDALGFSGTIEGQNLTMTSSLLLQGTAGTGVVGQINPNFGFDTNFNAPGGGGLEGVQVVAQLADGHINFENFDSGYNDVSNEGILYASNLMQPSFAGWHVVDAGSIVHNDLFPVV